MTNLDRLWIMFLFLGVSLTVTESYGVACLFITAGVLLAVASMANEGFRNK